MQCGFWWARLTARRLLMPGDELTVPRAISPNADAVAWPYEVFFDGSARGVQLPGPRRARVAGAGAVLWHRGPLSPPRCVGRAFLEKHRVKDVPEAEARAS